MSTHIRHSGVSLAERPAAPPLRRVWQVPTFLAGLLAIAGVYLGRPLWHSAPTRGPGDDLAAVRRLLDEPNADPNEIVTRARTLLDRVEADTPQAGEAHHLLGRALARSAATAAADQAPAIWREARTHLEEADRLGVAGLDQPRLRYQLAEAWLRAGGDKGRILDYLNQGIAAGAEERLEAFGLLAEAHLLPPADVKAALEANSKQLAQPTADDRLLAPARLRRGELLLQLKQLAKAREALEYVGRSAPPATRAHARLLLARCYQDEEKWEQAAAQWEQALADRDHPPPEPGAAAYALGTCYRRLPGREREAEQAWQRALPHGGPHAQAAALRLAELLLHEKPGEDTLPLFRQALGAVTRAEEYQNALIPLSEVQALLERGSAVCREAGVHERARDLARLLEKTGAAGRALTLAAEATEAWAIRLRGKNPGQARQLFREAGTTFEQAAAAGAPAADALLRGGACFRQAEAHADVVRVLDAVVRRPDLPERKGEAWFRIGEAQEALKQPDQARGAYSECIKHGGPFDHHARYQLAFFDLAAGDTDAAIKQLVPNVSFLEKVPEEARDRELYVKTLVTLGDLLVRQGRQENYQEPLSLYTRALEQVREKPAAWPIRFRLGECYRHLATRALAARDRALDPKVKQNSDDERLGFLAESSKAFENLEHELLAHRQAQGGLDPEQQALLDSLDFRIAGARFDRGQFPDALPRYQALAAKRAGTLEELVALEGVAWCARQTGADELLRATLDRVRTAARALPDALFTGNSEREKRAYWETALPRRLAGEAP